MGIAHAAVDLGLRSQRGYGIDNNDIKSAGLRQLLADSQSLFAGVGLRDNQVVEIDADLLRVRRVERMLGVDERRNATGLLRIGYDMKREGRLAGGLLTVALDDSPAGQTAYAKRHIEGKRTCGDHGDFLHLLISETHDRHLAEFLADLTHHRIKRGVACLCRFLCHDVSFMVQINLRCGRRASFPAASCTWQAWRSRH